MTFIVKEFGLGTGQSGLTKFIFEKAEKNKQNTVVYALFFEWITPQIDTSVFNNIVTISFNKFIKENKFKKGLEAFANYLLFLAKSENYEEIDINFALVKITSKSLFIAKFGDVDIFAFNKNSNSIHSLSEHIPANINLANLQYLKTSNISDNLLLFSNYEVLSNLINSNLLEVKNVADLFNSLNNLKNNILDSKLVVVLGEVELNIKHQVNINKGGNEEKVKKDFRQTQKIQQNALEIFNTFLLKARPIIKKISVFVWIQLKNLSRVLRHVTSNGVGIIKNKLNYKKFEKHGNLLNQINVSKTNESSELSMQHEIGEVNKLEDDEQNNKQALNSDKNNIEQEIDPLTYFRLKRTFLGRLKLSIIKLQKKLNLGILNIKFFNRFSLNKDQFVNKRIFAFLLLSIIGLVALMFLIFQYRHIKKLKALDTQYKQSVENKINSFSNVLNNIKQSNDVQRDISLFNDCNIKYKSYSNDIKKLQGEVNFVQTKEFIKNQQKRLEQLHDQCNNLYKQVFKIKTLDFTEIRDFKASFGQDSHITNVNVYKGILIVVDEGRKVVYQVNPENGKVIKLKDPTNKLKDPYKVSFGEAQDGTPIIFVCDRQNGILFYDVKNGFSAIPGTDNVAMGASCSAVGGFGTKAYFITEKGDAVYKLVNIGGGYAFPKPYITLSKSAKILDFAIDGSIYVLGQYPAQNGYSYDILKFFGGKKDNFILSKADKMRLKNPVMIFTNPSGYKPLYILDKSYKNIYVMEKPTNDKHAGVGVFIKTYDLSNLESGNITSFAVNLGVNNNKEDYIYVVANDKLFKARLK